MKEFINFLGDLSPRTAAIFLIAVSALISGAHIVDGVVRNDPAPMLAVGTSAGAGALLAVLILTRGKR